MTCTISRYNASRFSEQRYTASHWCFNGDKNLKGRTENKAEVTDIVRQDKITSTTISSYTLFLHFLIASSWLSSGAVTLEVEYEVSLQQQTLKPGHLPLSPSTQHFKWPWIANCFKICIMSMVEKLLRLFVFPSLSL